MGDKNKNPKRKLEIIKMILEMLAYIANIILVIYTILKG